jgi:uncharacterized paraquat-inducible protein A
MYKRLVKHLEKTRKPLWQACKELGIDEDSLDFDQLDKEITQCAHCDIWTSRPIIDLDQNPVCKLCADLAGL